jgi:hypothetical protein
VGLLSSVGGVDVEGVTVQVMHPQCHQSAWRWLVFIYYGEFFADVGMLCAFDVL